MGLRNQYKNTSFSNQVTSPRVENGYYTVTFNKKTIKKSTQ